MDMSLNTVQADEIIANYQAGRVLEQSEGTEQKEFANVKSVEFESGNQRIATVQEPVAKIQNTMAVSSIAPETYAESSENLKIAVPRDETKVTYIHDLKIIDYTLVYQKQMEKKRTVYKPGLDAKYSNRKSKAKQQSRFEQVIDSVSYIDVLKLGLGYFKSGAYEKSLENLTFILKKHPEELNAKFYGGLANFELGNYKKALKNFEFVIEHPIQVFNPESNWYKAQTLVRLGKLKKAENLLEQIILDNGFYAEKASILLNEIQQQEN